MELLAAVCVAGAAGIIALATIANMLALALDLDSNH